MELPKVDIKKYSKPAEKRRTQLEKEIKQLCVIDDLDEEDLKTFCIPKNNSVLFNLGKLNKQDKLNNHRLKTENSISNKSNYKNVNSLTKQRTTINRSEYKRNNKNKFSPKKLSNIEVKNELDASHQAESDLSIKNKDNSSEGNILITDVRNYKKTIDTNSNTNKSKKKKVDHINVFSNTENKSIRDFINKTRKIVEIKYSIKLKKERELRMKEFFQNYKEAIESSVKAVHLAWDQFRNDFLDKFETYVKSMSHIKERELNKLNSLIARKQELDSITKQQENKFIKLTDKLVQLQSYKKFLICVKENISEFPAEVASRKKDITLSRTNFNIFKSIIMNNKAESSQLLSNLQNLNINMNSINNNNSPIKNLKNEPNTTVNKAHRGTIIALDTSQFSPLNKDNKETSNKDLLTAPNKKIIKFDDKIDKNDKNRRKTLSRKKLSNKSNSGKKQNQNSKEEQLFRIRDMYFSDDPIFNSSDDLKTEMIKLENKNLSLLEDYTRLTMYNKELGDELKTMYLEDNDNEDKFQNEITKKEQKIKELKQKHKDLLHEKSKLQNNNSSETVLSIRNSTLNNNSSSSSDYYNCMKFMNSDSFNLKLNEIYFSANNFVKSIEKTVILYNVDNASNNSYHNNHLYKQEDNTTLIFTRIELVLNYLQARYTYYVNEIPYVNVPLKIKFVLDEKKKNKIIQENLEKQKKSELNNKLILEKSNKLYIKPKRLIPIKLKPNDKANENEIRRKNIEMNKEQDFKNLISFKDVI